MNGGSLMPEGKEEPIPDNLKLGNEQMDRVLAGLYRLRRDRSMSRKDAIEEVLTIFLEKTAR